MESLETQKLASSPFSGSTGLPRYPSELTRLFTYCLRIDRRRLEVAVTQPALQGR